MVERILRCVHSSRYNTRVWRADGRTDGRICHNNIALCMHIGMLTRDKNLRKQWNLTATVVFEYTTCTIKRRRHATVNWKGTYKYETRFVNLPSKLTRHLLDTANLCCFEMLSGCSKHSAQSAASFLLTVSKFDSFPTATVSTQCTTFAHSATVYGI